MDAITKKYEQDKAKRNLNPTAPAKVAMILYNKRYAEQKLGSMGFWDTLSSGEKKACIRYAKEIKKAPLHES